MVEFKSRLRVYKGPILWKFENETGNHGGCTDELWSKIRQEAILGIAVNKILGK